MGQIVIEKREREGGGGKLGDFTILNKEIVLLKVWGGGGGRSCPARVMSAFKYLTYVSISVYQGWGRRGVWKGGIFTSMLFITKDILYTHIQREIETRV